MVARQTAEDIEQEAAAWIMRRDREGETPALTRELEAWLASDPRRQGAFLVVESAWRWLDAAGSQQPEMPDSTNGAAGRPSDMGDRASPATRMTRRNLLAGAGGAMAACAIGYVAVSAGGRTYRTQRGEIRRIALADRSVATINTASRLDVSFRPDSRRISLDEGEAWFQVAHDATRPFTVSAGPVRVQAIGTAFSVRRMQTGTEILVTEGVVRTWTVGAEDRAVEARAGDRAFVANHATTAALSRETPAVARALAWRTGDIDLGGETLSHAVAEFNRYNSVTLVVADRTLADKPLYGVFRLDDPEGFARTVAAGLQVPLNGNPASSLVIGNVRKKGDAET